MLDNFEHLFGGDGPGLLSQLLAAAPTDQIVDYFARGATLARGMALPHEGLPFPTSTLPIPPTEFAAVELFVKRARQVRHDFVADEDPAALHRICQLVEGMPWPLNWPQLGPKV